MSSIIERLRQALAPDFRVERELASGGMGIVFLAYDVALDCPVAIKIIRPELATARAADHFLREARILAKIRHPGVVPIHRVGEADGVFYYVMDLIEGGTLADQLKQGGMEKGKVLKLGRDLLDALEAVHHHGTLHLDIKPNNIFMVGGRAILTDFGISQPSRDEDDPTTLDGVIQGTVGYMAPEQARGDFLTPRTDLYATAIVLYEAYSGRRWRGVPPDAHHDWAGVPHSVIPILRRALEWDPELRWPDAKTFRRKLWLTRSRRYRGRAAILAGAGLVAGALGVLMFGRDAIGPPQQLTDVAVIPLQAGSGMMGDSLLSDNLTILLRLNLESSSYRVTLPHVVLEWMPTSDRIADSLPTSAFRELGTEHIVWGTVEARGGDTIISLIVQDRSGKKQAVTIPKLQNLNETGQRLGFGVVDLIDPQNPDGFRGSSLSPIESALSAFLDGERAFLGNLFSLAAKRYRLALNLDTNFARAEWKLSNTHRWTLTGAPHPDVNLVRLLEQKAELLTEKERMLIEAQLAPNEQKRLSVYRDAIDRFPNDPFTTFLYAEELLGRGPQIGIALEDIVPSLEAAVSIYPAFGPAVTNLTWAYIRLGLRDEAVGALSLLGDVSPDREEMLIDQRSLLRFALVERFFPDAADSGRTVLFQDPRLAEDLTTAVRLAAMFDIPQTQVELAELFLTENPGADRQMRAHLHEALALGSIATGRVSQALTHFDSAASLLGSPNARIEAAEWRVMLPLLGLPGIPPQAIDLARLQLLSLVATPETRLRAAWALGIDAASRGDLDTGREWRDTLSRSEPDTTAERLGALLEAFNQAADERYQSALRISQPLLAWDSAGQGGDPFARAILHLKRAEWHEKIGSTAAADSARLFYQHFDFIGAPAGIAQAAEVDWALAPYIRLLQASAASNSKKVRACSWISRVLELWSDADSNFAALKSRATEIAAGTCEQ